MTTLSWCSAVIITIGADLALRNADKLKIKSGLVIQIIKAVRQLGLSREEAGKRMGLSQPKVSGLPISCALLGEDSCGNAAGMSVG